MDIIDQIEIPSFERKNANFRRNFAIAAGCVGLFYAVEQYNGSVSRTWKSVRRGITAAIAAWLEDHGGFPLFSPEGDEPVQLYHSALDLNGLCGPRLSHDDGTNTTNAAAYLTQSQSQNPQQQLPSHPRGAEAGGPAAASTQGSQDLTIDEAAPAAAAAAAAHLFASADTPSFFQSTKFFACLDVEEARELFRATKRVSLAPHEVLFRSGDPSDSGIYIVLHGTLGVFLEDPTHNTPPIHANTLRSGESVGDLDVVDGAVRTVSCMALESGCLLVNVPRELFMDFVHSHPRALMLYLQQGLARLWRVAHFVLADFLQLQLYRPKLPGSALAAETAAAATVAASAAGKIPFRILSNLFIHEQGTQTDPLPPSSLPMSPQAAPGQRIAQEVRIEPMMATVLAMPPLPQVDAVIGSPVGVTPVSEAVRVMQESSTSATAAVEVKDTAIDPVALPTVATAAVMSAATATDVTNAGAMGCVSGSGGSKKGEQKKKQALATSLVANDPGDDDLAEAPGSAAAATVAKPEAGEEHHHHQQPKQQQHRILTEELAFSNISVVKSPLEVATASSSEAAPVWQESAQRVGQAPVLLPRPYSPYASPRPTPTGTAIASSPSAPTFNELLASAAASARTRGAGGPTHGPLHPEALPEPSTLAAVAAAAALLANVPPLPPRTPPPPVASSVPDIVAAPSATTASAAATSVAAGLQHLPAIPPSGDGSSGIPSTATSNSFTADAAARKEEVLPPSVCAPLPHQEEEGAGSSAAGTAAAPSGSGSAYCSTGTVSASASTITSSSETSSTAAPRPLKPPLTAPSTSAGSSGSRGGGAKGLPGQRYGNGGLFGFPARAAEEGPRPQGPVCRWQPGRPASIRRSFVLGARACLAAGWDVIDVEELAFDDDMWGTFSDPRSGVGTQLPLAAGGMLQDVDWASGCFYLLLDGHLLAERPAGPPGGPEDGPGTSVGPVAPGPGGLRAGSAAVQESALIAPGSMVSCAAFLSSTASRCKVVALEPSRLVAFSWQTLEALVVDSPNLLIRLLVAASAALGPVVRRFISLGLNRVWLESGDVAYRQGDFAECLYVVISGRLRLLHETMHPVTHARQLHLEEEVGRGEAVGAVWAITGGHHDTTALCVRDSEVVRMSRSAFRVISADSPLALSKLFSNIARRLVAAWDSRVRSDRGASSSNAAATSSAAAAAAAAAGVGGGIGGVAATGALRGAGLPQLPNPARLGLTPLKSAGQLSASSGVVRGPRPSGRRGEIVTIAILPAGVLSDDAAAATMASALSGSPNDVAAAAAALAAGEAASMGDSRISGSTVGTSGTGRAGSYSGLLNGAGGAAGTSGQWRWPPGLSKQAAALATLTAIKRLSGALKDALSPFGPVLLLDATVLSLQFPTASERLDVLFYRSKVTSWMAAQEEEYRFILLEADVAASPWSSVCVAQADCILLVAPEGSNPQLSQPESLLVFNAASPAFSRPKPRRTGLTPALSAAPSSAHLMAAAATAPPTGATVPSRSPSRLMMSNNAQSTAPAAMPSPTPSPPQPAAAVGGVGGSQHPHHLYGAAQQLYGASSAAMLRRVELVCLHLSDGRTPNATADWLVPRPNLSRHHHIRLGRPTDIQRLARWMAGKTVGIVLSGGGSRGLAHLGVLTALEDAGVPLDAVGGTSQGAFMAALFAQGLGREALNLSVRHYAHQLGSVRHLLSDITLPVLSLFSGSAFDQAVKRVFERGAQRLEDLWLPFFCVTTNLTRGEASVHTEGTLWKLVRASMTIVGLLPPVWEDGCLLVDGGYMNNMPVDVMRSMMGVDSVIVVDVEGRDDMGWRSLTPYDGGLSGWRLLWDRLCPIPSWRFTAASAGRGRGAPRYAALINKLTSMTHMANLKRVAVEHRIDLYLRPPGVGGFRLLDFHLMDRIVKDAYRYATSAITQWKLNHRVGPFGIEETPLVPPPAAAAPLAAPGPLEVGPSIVATNAGSAAVGAGAAGATAAGGLSPSGPAGTPAVPGHGGTAAIGTPGGAGVAAAGAAGGGGSATVPSCMTQLRKKQQPAAAVLAAVTASVGGTVPTGGVPFVAPSMPQPPVPPAVSRRPTPLPGAQLVLPPMPPMPPPRHVLMASCAPPASSPASTSASISPEGSLSGMPSAALPGPAAASTATSSATSAKSTQQRRVMINSSASGGSGGAAGAAPTGSVVRFADRVLVSPVESKTPSVAAMSGPVDDSDDEGGEEDRLHDMQRHYRRSGSGASSGSGSAATAAAAGDSTVVGSPPPSAVPTLRPVMSRMSRSGTKHSLLDLQ